MQTVLLGVYSCFHVTDAGWRAETKIASLEMLQALALLSKFQNLPGAHQLAQKAVVAFRVVGHNTSKSSPVVASGIFVALMRDAFSRTSTGIQDVVEKSYPVSI